MKKVTWDNPNKMHMDSGFKLFDKQTNLISTGNVIANTQFSFFIRPYNEVKNGDYVGKPGDFLKFDLQYFKQIPDHIRKILEDRDREHSMILYQFQVFHGQQKEIIGHVLTDYDYRYITHSVSCPYGASFVKREAAIHAAMEYICEG